MEMIYKKLGLKKKIIVDLSELYNKFSQSNYLDILSKSDIKKMQDDWNKVGGDLRWGIEKYQKERHKTTKRQ
ncbi:hypothetical protein [Clostridium tyrobutyricum]|uniref:hypothetical protein n=1 Tax=Clostridium tyrobutyricum TaxID=1519 RepID=UPI001C393283|nr:hypothetical protein [Clostridium tyrobutyricum]MBV4417602.1 hypothetical protein [Clostridium tyrobutyricum]